MTAQRAYEPFKRYGLALRKQDVKRCPYDAQYLVKREVKHQLEYAFIPSTASYKKINSVSRFVEHWYGLEAARQQYRLVSAQLHAINPALKPINPRIVPAPFAITGVDKGGQTDESIALDKDRFHNWELRELTAPLDEPVTWEAVEVPNPSYKPSANETLFHEIFETKPAATITTLVATSGTPYDRNQPGINPETQEIFDTLALYPEVDELDRPVEDRMVAPDTEDASLSTFVERFTGVRMAKTTHRQWHSWMSPGDRPVDRYLGLQGRTRGPKAMLKEQKVLTPLDRALALPAAQFYHLCQQQAQTFTIDCVNPLRKAVKGITMDHTLRILALAAWIDDKATVLENQWAQCMSILTVQYGPDAALALATVASELSTGHCDIREPATA